MAAAAEPPVIARVVAAATRGVLRLLATRAPRVSLPGRVLRAIVLVPIFGAMLIVLRVRLLIVGPLAVDAEATDGVRLRCQLPDLIQMYVYLFGTWEPDLAAYVRRTLRAGELFVDVGANVGWTSALASRCVGDSGRVIAFEPSPDVLERLHDTIARNQLTNVRVVPSAVSDRRETLALFGGPRHNVGLTATVEHRGLRESGRVDAAPLPDLVPPAELARARLIKIDVEGAEDRVLAGLLPAVDRLHPDAELLVELSPAWWSDQARRPIDVLQPFLDRGFRVYLLPNDYWPWRYLWPDDVGPPRRLRDLAVLHRRVARLDVVLSRRDLDEL